MIGRRFSSHPEAVGFPRIRRWLPIAATLAGIVLIPALFPIAAGLGTTAGTPGTAPVLWVWSGAMTDESVVVKARVRAGGPGVRFSLQPPDNSSRPGRWSPTGFASPGPFGFVEFRISGLSPRSRYRFRVENASGEGLEGQFRTVTVEPASFRMAFASCATTGSDHPVFDAVRELDPWFFLHTGDFHYEDIEENRPERFVEAFDRVLASPRQSLLYRSMPLVYIWDDHDFGPDNADRTAPGRSAALEAYRRAVPHFPLAGEQGGPPGNVGGTIHQAFTVGRVRFLLTDLHSQRDPESAPDGPGKSMMGIEQRTWFLQELEQAAKQYPLVVWVSTVPWITRSGPRTDQGWQPYSWERRLIAGEIRRLGLVRRFLLLSGDAHMVAIDDGTNSNYASDAPPGEPGFPVMVAAPLDRYARIKGGPYSHGTVPDRVWFPWSKSRQFGLLEVEDDGRQLKVRLTGRDSRGIVLEGMELVLEVPWNSKG